MLRSIARRIAEGAGMAARPRSNAGDTAQSVPMSTNTPTGDKPTDRDESTEQEPNGHGIGLWAHDVSGGGEGEMLAVYSPDHGGQMDGEILYARPRVCVDLEDAR